MATRLKERDLSVIWKRDEVWFREHIPTKVPWGDESLLKEVPAEAEGHYGIELRATAQIDSEVYEEGQVAIVDSEKEWAQLLGSTDKIRSVLVPWFSRLIPVSLLVPHTETIDLTAYRKRIQPHLLKSLAITLGLGAVGYLYPEFLMLALLGAMFYGLFPLVSSAMAWCRRVDRLSVSDLNDELVRDDFFLRWVGSKSVRGLVVGVVILVLLFLGQLLVGRGESFGAAALVRSKVLAGGEWWRVITAGLLHGSVLHIFFNGSALYSLGRVLNALVRGGMFPTVFLISVVSGSLASLALRDTEVPSVGASGGILGFVGFLLVYAWRFRGELPGFLASSLVQTVIVLTVFGFLGSQFIDNAAHAGGLLGGAIVGLVASFFLRPGQDATGFPGGVVRCCGWVSCLILAAGAVKVGYELWSLSSGAGG